MKKTLGILAAVTLIVIAVFWIGSNMRKGPQAAVPPVTTLSGKPASTQLAPSVPALPVAAATKASSKPNAKDAVSAAALATSNLSQAQLMPSLQIRQVVTASVVPAQRPALMRAYPLTGNQLARFWGYSSVNDALLSAQYSVSTQKYRIAAIKGHRATIWLYTQTHWVTSRNLEYWIPGITVVHMRWVGGQWLYYGSSDPPASQAPTPASNLSYDQTVRRFQPFLRRFKPYEGS